MYKGKAVWFLILIAGVNILYAGKSRVDIFCNDEQANIYVDGKKQAVIKEGFANIFLEAGRHTIRAVIPVSEQYEKYTSKSILVNKSTPVKVKLELELYEPTHKYKKILSIKDKPKLKRWKRSDNMVVDSRLGFMWQDNPAAKITKKKWEDAKKYCQDLTLGGFDDWRLPNYDTLLTIVDYDRYRPAIMPIFENVNILDYYWCSNRYIEKKGGIWYVHFYNGRTYYNLKSNENYVRCVRDR